MDTGGRADDEAVAAIAGQQVAIHPDVQFDETRDNAAADDNVVERAFINQLGAAAAGGVEENARLELELPVPHLVEGAGQLIRRHGGQESQTADVDAEQRGAGARNLARHPQDSAVASEDQEQVRLAGEGGGIGQDRRLEALRTAR